MKKKLVFAGILAMALVFVLAGCGSNMNDDLPGKWYVTENASYDTTPIYEFTSDGRFWAAGVETGKYSASSSKITLTFAGVKLSESMSYSISGNVLTLSGPVTSGMVAGTYYKR